jgi:hypothetical protein
MAIVKSKYVRGKSRIKAHLRYITHRRGMEGERMSRPLFGKEGALSKLQIYDMIDAAKRGRSFTNSSSIFTPSRKIPEKT